MIHAHLTLGQFTAFYLYLNMLITPMRSLGVTLNLAQRATASGARIFQLLDREPRMRDRRRGQPTYPPGSGHVQLRERHAPLRARPRRAEATGPSKPLAPGRTVLHDIDLDVPAGRTVALVGATAPGKTSLVALISRLYDPSEGGSCSTAPTCATVTHPQLREAVAVVSDDPFLFSASVAENIAYARPDAAARRSKQAARRAQAHEFITRLPQGYDTQVGERGLTLSGGQRQRLAIARALRRRPARAGPRRRHLLGRCLHRAEHQARARGGDGAGARRS